MLALEAAVKMGAGGFHLGTKVCLALPGLRWLLWLWLLAAPTGDAFYLPGLVPIMYCEEGDPNPHCQSSIQIYADKLYSVESMAAYDYNSFDFCQDALKKTSHDTLWKILSGEQIIPCPYKFSFNKNETCRKVCVKSYTSEDEDQRKLAFLKGGIKQNYYHSWVIDNARVIWCYNSEDEEHYCILGFPIGCVNAPRDHFKGLCLNNLEFSKNNSLYLFNHVDITITYHMTSDTNGDVAKLISTRVDPKSYKHTDENHLTCNEPPLEIPEDADNLNVIYTYSVKFEESKAKWSSEWDYDVRTTAESNILWIRLINSFFVVLALCGLVIIVILKSICRDISKCNRIRLSEYERRQFGWLMIYKSVFRLPEHRMLLSVFLGQGTQIFIMTFFSLILVGLGFLTPVDPTDLVNYAVVLWFLLGIPAGYVAAKLYKTFKGGKWKMHFLLMTLLFPGNYWIFFLLLLY